MRLYATRIIELEGYEEKPYKDKKGMAVGIGQTNEFMQMSFKDTLEEHVRRTKELLPDFDSYPQAAQVELVQASYRGDLGHSPKFCRLMNEKKYVEASVEFLNNKEYRTAPASIKKRMEAVAKAVKEI